MRPGLIVLLILVLSTVFLAGCSTPSYSAPPPAQTSSNSPVTAVIAGTDDEWSFSMGCYAVVTGYAYNTGSEGADNEVIYLTLVYLDGTIRDTAPVYLGSIGPRESRNFRVILDTECGENYTIQAISTPGA
ncbi:MAG: hypothetical protein LUO93_11070 [Methanomicrobiales archaeon]|nr:hypothetical protein [Methanomicrobiales archaeon]